MGLWRFWSLVGALGTSHGLLLGIWDPKTAHTLKIDLWTKEMTVDDMKRFFHQTLLTMADSFERATNEHEMATDMREFSRYFGEQMGLLPRQQQ